MLNFYDGRTVYMDGDYPAIFMDGKNKHIHRLEWQKHYGEIPSGCVIHHKDGDKCNWNIDNLELLSRGHHLDQHRNEQNRSHLRGDNASHRTLSQSDVDYIRSVYIKYDKLNGGRALAKRFNVTEACISAIIHNKNWSGGLC